MLIDIWGLTEKNEIVVYGSARMDRQRDDVERKDCGFTDN